MTKQVTRLAESVASRRGFLGQIARVSAGAVAGLACVLATKPASAKGKHALCVYLCEDGTVIESKMKGGCIDYIETRKHGRCRLWW